MAGFPLPGSTYFVNISENSRRTTVKIYRGTQVVVDVKAGKKRLATERAFDALQEYCFRGHRKAAQPPLNADGANALGK